MADIPVTEFGLSGTVTYYAVIPSGASIEDVSSDYTQYDTRVYNTLAAAVAALPSSPSNHLGINILGEWSAFDTTAVDTRSCSTSSSAQLYVRTIGSARFAGTYSSSHYGLAVSGTTQIKPGAYNTYSGLQLILPTDRGANTYGFYLASVTTPTIDACLITSVEWSGTNSRIAIYAAGTTDMAIRNTVICKMVNTTDTQGQGLYTTSTTTPFVVENVTIYGCYVGWQSTVSSSVSSITNVTISNCTSTWSGSFSSFSGSNNHTDDSVIPPGTNPVSGTPTFVDIDNCNFQISSTDTVLLEAGTDLSSEFTIDISGTTRSLWSIGAWDGEGSIDGYVEAVAGGPGAAGILSVRGSEEITTEEFGLDTSAVYYAVIEDADDLETVSSDYTRYSTRVYTSLAAARAAMPATPSTEIGVNILGTWTADDDATGAWSSACTSSTKIYVRTIGDARHGGKWTATAHRIVTAEVEAVTVSADYHVFCGIQLSCAYSGLLATSLDNITVDSCIGTGGSIGAFVLSSCTNLTLRNCISYNTTRGYWLDLVSDAIIDNCTAYGTDRNYYCSSGTGTIRNCVSSNATSYTWYNASGFSGATNHSDSTVTAPGTDPISGTVTFVDANNGDFQISSDDTIVYGAGTDLSSEFTTDISGVTRTLWSVGAWDGEAPSVDGYVEAVAGGPGAAGVFSVSVLEDLEFDGYAVAGGPGSGGIFSGSKEISTEEFGLASDTIYYAVIEDVEDLETVSSDYTQYDTRVYTSLADAAVAIPSTPSTNIGINILGEWTADDGYVGAFTNVCTATTQIYIRTIGASRHSGKYSSTIYRAAANTTNIIEATSYMIFSGLYFKQSGGTSDCCISGTSVNNITIDNCIFEMSGQYNGRGVAILDCSYIIVRNCIAFNGYIAFRLYESSYFTLQNLTAYQCRYNYNLFDALNSTATNCIAQLGYSSNWLSSSTVTGNTNQSSDGDAPGTDPISGTVTFVDANNGDFQISSDDTVVYGVGTDLSSEFTTDISGVTRTLWSVGAWDGETIEETVNAIIFGMCF